MENENSVQTSEMTNNILDDALSRLSEIEKIQNIDDAVGQSYFFSVQDGETDRAKIHSDRSTY